MLVSQGAVSLTAWVRGALPWRVCAGVLPRPEGDSGVVTTCPVPRKSFGVFRFPVQRDGVRFVLPETVNAYLFVHMVNISPLKACT